MRRNELAALTGLCDHMRPILVGVVGKGVLVGVDQALCAALTLPDAGHACRHKSARLLPEGSTVSTYYGMNAVTILDLAGIGMGALGAQVNMLAVLSTALRALFGLSALALAADLVVVLDFAIPVVVLVAALRLNIVLGQYLRTTRQTFAIGVKRRVGAVVLTSGLLICLAAIFCSAVQAITAGLPSVISIACVGGHFFIIRREGVEGQHAHAHDEGQQDSESAFA